MVRVRDLGSCIAFAGIALGLLACTHHATTRVAPAPLVRATLVDSVPWQSDDASGYLRRIEVHAGDVVDTIPGVMTAERPLVVGTRVLGFAYQEDEIVGAFTYDAEHRSVKRDSLPPDFNGYFSAPSIAPDGRHIAYIVIPGDATGQGVVATWPGGARVWKSDRVEIPATDALGGNLTRWLSPDTAELFIESGAVTGEQWFHVVFSVTGNRVVRADTVRHR